MLSERELAGGELKRRHDQGGARHANGEQLELRSLDRLHFSEGFEAEGSVPLAAPHARNRELNELAHDSISMGRACASDKRVTDRLVL